MIKKLYIDTEKNKTNGNTHSEYYEMYTLYNALKTISTNNIDSFKENIITKLEKREFNTGWNFTPFRMIILSENYFLLYDPREEYINLEKTYICIKQEALWQAIRDYNKFDIYSKKYKRITISYDGNKVYFDLEPFETNKENV